MPIGLAVTAILAFTLSIACLKVANDVKMWRLRWMDFLGVLDVESDRDMRKSQEKQMAMICFVLFALFAAVAISCAYWTMDEIREVKREKSPIEREMDMGRKEIDGLRARYGR